MQISHAAKGVRHDALHSLHASGWNYKIMQRFLKTFSYRSNTILNSS